MGEPGRDEVIDVPEADDVHAEVCIRPDCHREDSGFSNDGEDNVQHKLSELEDKLYRRCFDKVTSLIWKYPLQLGTRSGGRSLWRRQSGCRGGGRSE